MVVIYDPEDRTYYTASGYWVPGIDLAEKFTDANIAEAIWLASYFEARILSYPDLVDITGAL